MENCEDTERSFFLEKDEVLNIIHSLSKELSSKTLEEKFENVKRILDRYQEQPQLIGPHTEDILKPLNNSMVEYIEGHQEINDHFHTICKVIQILCKVRGAKQSSKYLPNDVHLLEPCVAFIKRMVCDRFHFFYLFQVTLF